MSESPRPLLSVSVSCETRLWDAVRETSGRVAQMAGFHPDEARTIGQVVNDVVERMANGSRDDSMIDLVYSSSDGVFAVDASCADPIADLAAGSWLDAARRTLDRVECRRDRGRTHFRFERALPTPDR